MQRTRARKILLNSKDQFNFNDAPDYVVNAFFDRCFVNGISYEGMIKLIRWIDYGNIDRRKIDRLWSNCYREPYKLNWYAYNCHLKCVIYLNGIPRYKK